MIVVQMELQMQQTRVQLVLNAKHKILKNLFIKSGAQESLNILQFPTTKNCGHFRSHKWKHPGWADVFHCQILAKLLTAPYNLLENLWAPMLASVIQKKAVSKR